VRTLRLNECDVDNKVGSLLAEALEENRCLRVLSLCRNRIGPAGAAKLAEVLRTNHSLTKLDLSKNPLGDEGAENLAAGLCQSRALSSLDLQVTQIGDAGAVALAASLREARLRELHLRDNLIGDKGAQSLADALHSSTLALLDLSFNRHIGALGVQKLTEAVEQSDTITVLAVHGFRRSRQEITRLEAALDKNKRTQVLTLHCIPDGELCKASCTQMSGAELLELSLAPETPLWQVFASVAEAMTQPADSLRLITSAGQEILSTSQESL
ncbi:NLRC3, partial [Symbiodinium microadriaticum]